MKILIPWLTVVFLALGTGVILDKVARATEPPVDKSLKMYGCIEVPRNPGSGLVAQFCKLYDPETGKRFVVSTTEAGRMTPLDY